MNLERPLGDPDEHRYSTFLRAGGALRIQVDQRGVDIKIAAFDPFGKPIVEVDRPCGSFCRERIVLVAKIAGSYRLKISKSGDGGPEGRYVISSAVQGAATPADRRALEASRAYEKAKRLARAGEASDIKALDRDFSQAIRDWKSAGWVSGQADSSFDWAEAQFQRKRYADSRALALRAAALYGSQGETVAESFALVHAGRGSLSLKNYQRAMNELDAGARAATVAEQELAAIGVRARFRRTEVRKNLLRAQIYLGQIAAEETADFAAATYYLPRARDLAHALGDKGLESRALSLLGLIYLKAGDLQRSFELEREARSLLPTGDTESSELTSIRSQFARIYLDIELPERAAEIYQDLLTVYGELGRPKAQANVALNLSQALYALDRFDDALAAAERARKLYEILKTPQDVVSVLIVEGWILGHQDKTEEARAAFLEAQRSSHLRAGSLDELSLYFGLADLERRHGDLRRARQFAERMMAIAQRLGPKVDDPAQRARLVAKLHDVYDFWIELLVEMDPPGSTVGADQAFAVSESVSGTSFREASTLRAKQVAGARPLAHPNDPRVTARKLLDEQTVLLEYYLAEDVGFLWITTQDTARMVKIQGKRDLKPKVDSFHRWLAASKTSGSRILAQRAAYEMTDFLLRPAEAELAAKKRLLVVVPATLEYIPFAVLPLPEGRKDEARDEVWPEPLSSRYEIVVIPSLTAIAAQRSVPVGRKGERRMVLFDDSVTDPGDCRFSGPDDCLESPAEQESAARAPFRRLTHARDEGTSVAESFAPGRVDRKSGFEAQRSLFLGMPLSKFAFLHFVVHGVWNRADPGGSALVLALYDRQGRRLDGYLRASDIDALHLDADLVVLSACSSGLGHEIWGEGLSGLWQAFLRAGAKRVVVSLWDVNDRATSIFMAHFYEGIFKRGLTPAAALRFAQEEMRRIPLWSSPYYWGSFVLKGDWR